LKVFVAGAGGVIGRRLAPLLLQRGYEVFGSTRSADRAGTLQRAGVQPVVVDALDREAVARALESVRPQVVIHQLTDLSGGFAPEQIAETLARNTRLRVEGTRNLAAAAKASGVRRLIAQSIVWLYAAGPEPHSENDPLDRAAGGATAVNVQGVVALEEAVLNNQPVEGIVLRYGWFYGPGANERPAGAPGVHVDAAADAAALAIERGTPGIYNVAEPGPHVAIEKAQRELGWDPGFRRVSER
jgi:nucleoside-diphosphate-sugar epimerase